jgi:hypothetical protein
VIGNKEQSIDRLAPNYVFSTPVAQDILDFFHQFARDVVSKDTRSIAANYARAYETGRDAFGRVVYDTPYPLMFGPSPPNLEYVHITKICIEKSRAYLRGSIKFDYINIFAGLVAVWNQILTLTHHCGIFHFKRCQFLSSNLKINNLTLENAVF